MSESDDQMLQTIKMMYEHFQTINTLFYNLHQYTNKY